MDDRTAKPSTLGMGSLKTLLCLLLLSVALSLSACSSSEEAEPVVPEVTEEEAAAAEAEAAAAEAEAVQAAAEAAAAAAAEAAELEAQKGQLPVVVERERSDSRIPFDEAFPTTLHEPTVHIAVMSSAHKANRGQEVAVMLAEQEKDTLQDALGMAVKIAYVSQRREPIDQPSSVHYRDGYFKAAVHLAGALPGEQLVARMTPEEELRIGMDVIIYLSEQFQ